LRQKKKIKYSKNIIQYIGILYYILQNQLIEFLLLTIAYIIITNNRHFIIQLTADKEFELKWLFREHISRTRIVFEWYVFIILLLLNYHNNIISPDGGRPVPSSFVVQSPGVVFFTFIVNYAIVFTDSTCTTRENHKRRRRLNSRTVGVIADETMCRSPVIGLCISCS